MSECLDLNCIITNKDNIGKNADLEKSLKKLCHMAKYSDDKKIEMVQVKVEQNSYP